MGALAKRKRLLKIPRTGVLEASEGYFFKARIALVTGTTSGTAETQTTHPHGLEVTPLNNQIIFVGQDKAGSIYCSAVADETNFYVKCDIVTVSFTAIILYEV